MDKLSASEALYGFVGWLTSRDTPVTMSARHEAGSPAELVGMFCEANSLAGPRSNWVENLVHPKESA